MKMNKRGVSKNILAILLILAILISIVGTYVSLTSVNNVRTAKSSGNAFVGVEIVRPQIGQVGVDVIPKEGENNG